MNNVKLCLFSSTPDMNALSFIVKVLTGSPAELAERAVAWGYDGIELMPDPERVPDPVVFETALKNSGAVKPVVNTGRFFAQGLPPLVTDTAPRRCSLEGFKSILSFAGYFRARLGLGADRRVISISTIPAAGRPESSPRRTGWIGSTSCGC